MTRCRICLWLLMALAVPAQAITSYSERLPCNDHAGGTASAVQMDCHAAHEANAGHPPDCCGDACPDMAACAAPPAAGPSAFSQPLPDERNVPVDRYALPLITALFPAPFRPPAFSRA